MIPRLTGSDAEQSLPDMTAQDNPGPSAQLAASSSATPAAGARAVGNSQAPVTRGSIDETFNSFGRVVASGEEDVSFPGTGKIDALAVRPGDKVEPGQLLLQTDSQQIQKDLTAARTRLDNDAARVQQAMDQTAGQARAAQRDAAKRAADDEQRRQQAVADAQVNLRRAQDNMEKVQTGPLSTDVRTAQTAVANAQASLNKAAADRDNLRKGANPADVRAAERIVASAQTDVDKAQAEVDRLTRGPDPIAISAAEREAARAQTALTLAQSIKVDNITTTQAQKDAQIANATLNLQDAQDKLQLLKQPPAAADVSIAQRNLQVAHAALDAARQNLDTIKKGPDQATLDAADQAVDNATAVVANAQDRLDELQSHPTPQELREAQDRVNLAQTALNSAQKPSPANAALDTGADEFNIQLLQKTVAQDQADVDTLEKQLAATRLLAPIAGVVTAVQVRAGDAVDPTHPVLTLSTGGAPGIAVDLSDQDAAKIKPGQSAHVLLDGANVPLEGSVSSLAANQAAGVGRTATLKMNWTGNPPAIGSQAQVSIIEQAKNNVLLIPRKAIRSAGSRKFVQYMSGSSRKVANVEVGIVSDTMAEIASGLSEGQVVVVGP
jgi:HlyD family secretion protein